MSGGARKAPKGAPPRKAAADAGRPRGPRRAVAPTTPIVPRASVAGRALVTVVSIMSFLACLTIAGVLVVRTAAAGWEADLRREVTIQVRPVDGVDMGAALDRAVSIAEAAPGIGTVRTLSPDETKGLLAPWLGSGLDLDALPVPRLISVTVADPTKTDLPALGRALAAEVKGASLDDHASWTEHMASMANSVVLAGLGILVLVLTAMILCVVFATRAAMAANREIVEVLHLVGAENRFVAREFERHFLRLGLTGGALGGGAAIVTFLVMALLQRAGSGTAEADQARALFGGIGIGWTAYAATILVAAAVALLTALTSRISVVRHLSRML